MSGISAVRRQAARIPTKLLRAGAISLAVAGAVTAALAATTANAQPPTPRVVEGNVTTCAEAGLSGEILFGSSPDYVSNPTIGTGTVSGGTTLDVTLNPGFTASGIVVKGGPDTNVYDGPFVGPITITGMTSPPNPGGQIPEISHWFVCGGESMSPTPTMSPSPSPTPSPSPSPSPTMSPSPSPSPTMSPSPTVSPTPVKPTMPASPTPTKLPLTGTTTSGNLGVLLGSAAAMLGVGTLLITFGRKHRTKA